LAKPCLYVLVTNSLHQDQRLHRICDTLTLNDYDIILVGKKDSKPAFKSKVFKTASLNTVFKSGVLFYLEINLRFFFFLLFKKFDGVVVNDLDSLLAGKLITTLKRKKLFIDLHEYFTEVPELKNRRFKKWIWDMVGRIGISDRSINYTVNYSLAKILGEKYKANFETIYNYPITINNEEHISQTESFDLVYVGVVNKGRGLREAIFAVNDLDDMTLTIFGVGDEYDQISNIIIEQNLTSKIFLKGFIPNNNISAQLQTFDLGLNLLDSTSHNYYYSSANKYFDYMMAGIPTLSMNFPEYKKHNEQHKTSVLIDTLDIKLIKATLLNIKNNPSLLRDLKSNCTQAKQIFNWQSQASKLLKIYNSIFNL